MDTQGGRYSATINGKAFSGRAEAKLKPARGTPENGVNWNGKGFSFVKPQLSAVELTFDRGQGLKWDEAMILQSIDLTFVEDDARVAHYFTAARWSGEPEINTKDGEVSGMKIESDQYRSEVI
ncbi:phage tail tube protein [uncultured Methylobacterium sp.]|uniref:phage tail tube protein n=1 Tax=uncultured Methylobacterium sp. TaxID=157278 RepID=UPI0035CC602B